MAFWPPLAASTRCECLHARTSDVGYGKCRFSHEEKASAAEDGDDEEEDL